MMLQQTQVDHVIPKYLHFLERFPTAADLANASRRDVIFQWAGLGYNRRALYLQRAAQKMISDYQGRLPDSLEALRSLPGVGSYTAGALLSFAHRKDQAALDTNVRRVIHRFFAEPEIPKQTVADSVLIDWAQAIIPRGKGWLWNHAMMDFGALICTAKIPKCDSCPLQTQCRSAFKIQVLLSTARPRKHRRVEPAPDSTPKIPNRIYRGRVVERLREMKIGAISPARIVAKQIKPDFKKEEWAWFERLLKNLEQDGLIALIRQRRKLFLRLP